MTILHNSKSDTLYMTTGAHQSIVVVKK